MQKMIGFALLTLSSLFLTAWFPAVTPDQRIAMEAQWGWSHVETDLDNDGSLDEIVYSHYDDRGRLLWKRWDTPHDTHYQDLYYNAYGRLEYEEWDYHDDGTIDEVYYYDYNSNDMLFRLRMDFDADNEVDEAVYYSYYAGRLVQREIDYDLDGTPDEVTEYSYDRSGRVVRGDHYSSDPAWDDQTTFYSYDESGRVESQEEDYDDDGLIDYISLYYYDTAGRPYRELDNDVQDDPRTEYQDATRTFFYDYGSDCCHDDCIGYCDDDSCFISTAASDRRFPPGLHAPAIAGLVLAVVSSVTKKIFGEEAG